VTDQSLIDNLTNLRAISVACGQGVLSNEDLSTDTKALQTFIGYYNKVCTAMGQGTVTDTSSDVLSALRIISQLLGKIVKTVS
jgi:hypothetical protein